MMRPLATLPLLFLVSACTTAQMRRFEAALNGIQQSQAGALLVRRSIDFVVEHYAETALGKAVALRERETGPITGRWFITGIQSRERRNGDLVLTLRGVGYTGHSGARNVTFGSTAVVEYRTNLQFEGDTAFVTFTPVTRPRVDFEPLRIQGLVASLLPGLVRARGQSRMRDRLERGFTVAMDRRSQKRMYLGLGPRKEMPPRPFVAPAARRTFANDLIQLHEDGRDFIGPIPVRAGEHLRIHAATRARWGFDGYLLDDRAGAELLNTYISPRRRSHPVGALCASNGGRVWDATWTAPRDTSVWVMLDNSDAGRSVPPRNLRDDVLDIAAFVGTVPYSTPHHPTPRSETPRRGRERGERHDRDHR